MKWNVKAQTTGETCIVEAATRGLAQSKARRQMSPKADGLYATPVDE